MFNLISNFPNFSILYEMQKYYILNVILQMYLRFINISMVIIK
jgi:hypothetical protein